MSSNLIIGILPTSSSSMAAVLKTAEFEWGFVGANPTVGVIIMRNKPINRDEYNLLLKRCKKCGKIIPYEKRRNTYCNNICKANPEYILRVRNTNNKEHQSHAGSKSRYDENKKAQELEIKYGKMYLP